MRGLLYAAMAIVMAACSSSSVPARPASGSLLTKADLPPGWIIVPSTTAPSTVPCIRSAERPLATFPSDEVTFTGEANHLASGVERIVLPPASDQLRRFINVVNGYAGCNGTTWTSGATALHLSVASRAVAPVPGAVVRAFSVNLSSPDTNVEPNPEPGLVDLALVDHKMVLLSMGFANVPLDASTFDLLMSKAIQRAR